MRFRCVCSRLGVCCSRACSSAVFVQAEGGSWEGVLMLTSAGDLALDRYHSVFWWYKGKARCRVLAGMYVPLCLFCGAGQVKCGIERPTESVLVKVECRCVDGVNGVLSSLAREIVRSSRRAARASMCSHGSFSGSAQRVLPTLRPSTLAATSTLKSACGHVMIVYVMYSTDPDLLGKVRLRALTSSSQRYVQKKQ